MAYCDLAGTVVELPTGTRRFTSGPIANTNVRGQTLSTYSRPIPTPPVTGWKPPAPPASRNTQEIDSFRDNQPRSFFTNIASTRSALAALVAIPWTSPRASKTGGHRGPPLHTRGPAGSLYPIAWISPRAFPAPPFPSRRSRMTEGNREEELKEDYINSFRASVLFWNLIIGI